MGWTYTHAPRASTLELLQKEISERFEIVESSIKLTEAYLAIRDKETGEVQAAVVLIHRAPKEYHNFGTKWIDEEMVPFVTRAPAKVLNALSPTTNKDALKWREACRAHLAQASRNRGLDLTGKRVGLYGKYYTITGKHQSKRGSWSAVGEHNGLVYRITRAQVSKLVIVEEQV